MASDGRSCQRESLQKLRPDMVGSAGRCGARQRKEGGDLGGISEAGRLYSWMQGSEEEGTKPRIMLLEDGWRGQCHFLRQRGLRIPFSAAFRRCVSEQPVRQRRVAK